MRTFFCYELPSQVRQEMRESLGRVSSPARVKWVNTENIHITVKFLGEINEDQLQEIKEAIEEPLKRHSPFTIEINHLGGFPRLSYPKVIWLGSDDPPEEIHGIHRDLEETLEELGFEREDRDYVPHVTLGRTKEKDSSKVKTLGNELKNEKLDRKWQVEISHLTLMQSRLRSSGPIYDLLFKAPL
ncbi:MAG: RNA 2',3'-cyclic phosphodiesterase [Candidatus Acetothermia bacterium]